MLLFYVTIKVLIIMCECDWLHTAVWKYWGFQQQLCNEFFLVISNKIFNELCLYKKITVNKNSNSSFKNLTKVQNTFFSVGKYWNKPENCQHLGRKLFSLYEVCWPCSSYTRLHLNKYIVTHLYVYKSLSTVSPLKAEKKEFVLVSSWRNV